MSKQLSSCLIIVPAFNEELTIFDLVMQLKKYGDVCVVNDCSTDRTGKILDSIQDINVITHTKNTHITNTILDGIEFAIEKGYQFAITIDAGFSHDPKEIPKFLDASPSIDLLIGYRVKKVNVPLYRHLLSLSGNLFYNVILNFTSSLFLKKRFFKDLTSGYRRYSYKSMTLLIEKRRQKKIHSRAFDFLIESSHLIYKNRFTIDGTPISYHFSNSSLRSEIVFECLRYSFKALLRIY